MPWKRITRQELYDQVWSQAVSKLAPQYNLSDVGFAKLCKRYDIPRPPRGYWAKLEAGKKVKKTPLPKLGEEPEIRFYERDPEEVRAIDETKSEVAGVTESLPTIEVASTLRGAHQLVSATRQAYEKAQKREDGLLQPPEGAALDLFVSRDQLHRSLLVMDALLKAFESLGHKVAAGPKVEAFGHSVSFGIRESTNTVEEEFEPTGDSVSGTYDFFHERRRKKQVPSGRLAILIPDAEAYWASGFRKQWKDAKIQRIENCLNSVVASVLEVAAKKRDHAIAEEKRRAAEVEAEARRIAEAKRREQLREQQKAEQRKLDGLLEQVNSWKKSREIRAFVEHVRNTRAANGTAIEPESELGRWLAWGAQQADRLDPTVDSPKTILDEVIPEEPDYKSRRYW